MYAYMYSTDILASVFNNTYCRCTGFNLCLNNPNADLVPS